MSKTKLHLLWAWAQARGFAFLAYVLLWASSINLYRGIGEDTLVPYNYAVLVQLLAVIGGIACFLLVTSGLAGAYAVVRGVTNISAFLVKLELPSLRVMAFVTVLYGAFAFDANRPVTGTLQLTLGMLLLHEMRWLTTLRKRGNGRPI